MINMYFLNDLIHKPLSEVKPLLDELIANHTPTELIQAINNAYKRNFEYSEVASYTIEHLLDNYRSAHSLMDFLRVCSFDVFLKALNIHVEKDKFYCEKSAAHIRNYITIRRYAIKAYSDGLAKKNKLLEYYIIQNANESHSELVSVVMQRTEIRNIWSAIDNALSRDKEWLFRIAIRYWKGNENRMSIFMKGDFVDISGTKYILHIYSRTGCRLINLVTFKATILDYNVFQNTAELCTH